MSAMAANQRASMSLPLESSAKGSRATEKKEPTAPAWANARLSLRPVVAGKDNKAEDLKVAPVADAPKRPASWALPSSASKTESEGKSIIRTEPGAVKSMLPEPVLTVSTDEPRTTEPLLISPKQAQSPRSNEIEEQKLTNQASPRGGGGGQSERTSLEDASVGEVQSSNESTLGDVSKGIPSKQSSSVPTLDKALRKPPIPPKPKSAPSNQLNASAASQPALQSDSDLKSVEAKDGLAEIGAMKTVETATQASRASSSPPRSALNTRAPDVKDTSPSFLSSQSEKISKDRTSPRSGKSTSEAAAQNTKATLDAPVSVSSEAGSEDSSDKPKTGKVAQTAAVFSKPESSASVRMPSVRISPGDMLAATSTKPHHQQSTSESIRMISPSGETTNKQSSSSSSTMTKGVAGAFPSVKERAQTFSAASKPPAAPRVVVSANKSLSASVGAARPSLEAPSNAGQTGADEAAAEEKKKRLEAEEAEEKAKRESQREIFLRAYEQVKQEALASTAASKTSWSDDDDSDDDKPSDGMNKSPAVSPANRTPNSSRAAGGAFFSSNSPSSGTAAPLFPRPDTKVHSTTPLAPFSATSKPPPNRSAFGGSETPVAAASRPAARAAPPLPSARPSSVSLGPSAVPFAPKPPPQKRQPLEDPTEAKRKEEPPSAAPLPAAVKRPLSLPRSPPRVQGGNKRPPPLPEVRVRSRSRSGSGSSSSMRTKNSPASSSSSKKKQPSPLAAKGPRVDRTQSVDEDFDEYEGVEVFHGGSDEEDDGRAKLTSGRTTPPPPPPMTSGRDTPPPPPPPSSREEDGDNIQVAGKDEVIDWSEDDSDEMDEDDFDDDDDSEEEEEEEDARASSAAERSLMLHHHRSTHVYQDQRGGRTDELAHMLGGARLRTTTFPTSEGMVEFDTRVPTTPNAPVEDVKPEPPPLPRRPSKATPTPLPPDPALTSPRARQLPPVQTALGSQGGGAKPLSLDSPSNSGGGGPASSISPRAHAASSAAAALSRLGSSGNAAQSRSSVSSVLAPEHKAFLVDRLGYSPDRLIQLAPLGGAQQQQQQQMDSTAGSRRLERWRGALKRQQSALSNRAASALSLVLETFKVSLGTRSEGRQQIAMLPRAVLGSLARRLKAPRMLTVSVPSSLHGWRRNNHHHAPPSMSSRKKSKSSSSSSSSPSHLSQQQSGSGSLPIVTSSKGKHKKGKTLTTRVVFRKRGRGFSSSSGGVGDSATTTRKAPDVFAEMAAAEQELLRSVNPSLSPSTAALAAPLNDPSAASFSTNNTTKRFGLKRPSDLSTNNKEGDPIVRPQNTLNEAKSGIRWSRVSHGNEWL